MKAFLLCVWSNLVLPGCFLFLGGCLEDRTFPAPETPSGTTSRLRPGLLRINEIQPAGTPSPTEPGDWVEIFNTSDTAVQIQPGSFWITDNPETKFSYSIRRAYTIPAKGFLTVFFVNGGQDTSSRFPLYPEGNLSASSGEFVGFYFLGATGDTIVLDTVSFPAAPGSGQTYGRIPDGSGPFRWLQTPTRNQSNHAQASGDIPPGPNRLVINEIDPNGAPDWFELANPFSDTIRLQAGRWFFTDDTSQKEKYPLPVDFVVGPKAYLTVDCSSTGLDADASQLRTKFSLSSNGETVALYFREGSGQLVPIQVVTFPAGLITGQSYSRRPDLTGPFSIVNSPSKGASNP